MPSSPDRVATTGLLLKIGASDAPRESLDQLFSAVYDELRGQAAGLMRQERQPHTLRPTALVHEAYLRLIDDDRVSWESRAHFFGIAARAMRQILVEHARARATQKRGGGMTRVTLDTGHAPADCAAHDVLVLDSAMSRLAALNARVADVVELKVFAGMEMRELAQALGVSKRTAEGDWTFGRMWLGRELAMGESPTP
jgi:RNA polymerase sigma-70 factor (ECF subfamily)